MKKLCLGLALCLIVFGVSVFAQSTIFNAPSTDVKEKGRGYVELDFIAHFDKFEKGGFQTYGWRSTYGITKKIEVGANVFYTSDGTGKVPFLAQPNAKWQVYSSEKNKFAVSTGIIASVPLNSAAGSRATGMVYTNVSKEFSKLGDVRTTFGAYKMLNTENDDQSTAGIFIGIEKPIFKRVAFTGDWFSGKNGVGYATPGFSVVLNSRQIFGAGYSFGNSGRGNNALTTYYGISF
ncbi:MAG: hypothetical protein KDB79_16215 [Acidobacteria bacterium]|nr:hypothetical protein [Acidobacteriota bacterium]